MKELLESLRIEGRRDGSTAVRTPPARGWRRRALPLSLLAGLSLAAGGWSWVRSRPLVVETVTVRAAAAGAPAVTLTAGGYVRASRVVYVVPRVPGRIASLSVREGDVVNAGDLVAVIDGSDLDQEAAEARANLELAQATLEKLQSGSRPEEIGEMTAKADALAFAKERTAREVARSRALFDAGLISAQSLDEAVTMDHVSARSLESARQALALVEKGPRAEEIRIARAARDAARARAAGAANRRGYARVTAPVSGRVLRRFRYAGDLVSPEVPYVEGNETLAAGSPVVSLADLSEPEVSADINETDIHAVRLRQPVEVVPSAWPDEVIRGVVTLISPRADRNKNTIEVKAALEAPPRPLPVDMSVKLRFLEEPGAPRSKGLQVPSRAVVERAGRHFLWVASASRASARNVELGGRDGDLVTIVRGVAPGETVIVSRLPELEDGKKVRLR